MLLFVNIPNSWLGFRVLRVWFRAPGSAVGVFTQSRALGLIISHRDPLGFKGEEGRTPKGPYE